MPRNNGVYCSCYVEHHLNLSNVHQQITTCTHNVLSTRFRENKSNQMLNHTKFISVETLESIHVMLCSRKINRNRFQPHNRSKVRVQFPVRYKNNTKLSLYYSQ